MKRLGILFILFAFASLAGGCQGSIYSNYRDVERLRPVQTLGIDASAGTVTVAVAAGEGQGEAPPSVLKQSAESVEAALVQLQNAFPEAQPYYAHVQYILLGSEAATAGMDAWLDWIERSPSLRLDAAIYIVRGSASELMLSAAAEHGGTSEKLASLDSELRELGEGVVVSVRSLAAALAANGTGLCSAVEAVDEADDIRFDDSAAIQPAGFAVFQNGALCAFIEQDDAAGVLLLLGQTGGARLTVKTDSGIAAVRLGCASTNVEFAEGRAAVHCDVEAVLVEAAASPDIDALNAAIAAALTEQAERVVALEASLGCDFLDILQGHDPAALDFSVSVTVRAEHGYGLRPQEDTA